MAERRMFSKTIVESDAFLDMPLSAQALYFHFGMLADDDGFINSPRKIQRMVGAAEDDLKILLTKKFILLFESGIIVIKHWKINNLIRKDRYHETVYKMNKEQLFLKENGAYTFDKNKGLPLVNQMVTEVSLGKVNKLNYTKLKLYYLYIIGKIEDFEEDEESYKSSEERSNEKLVVERVLRRLEILGNPDMDILLTEETRRKFVYQYWAIREICKSSYRVFLKNLTRDMFLNKFEKTSEYIDIKHVTEFIGYFIKSVENELKDIEEAKVLKIGG